MLKLLLLTNRSFFCLITVQDNTMLKLIIFVKVTIIRLITVQDNAMLKQELSHTSKQGV